MERVTGKRLPEIVSERLWGPMGAEEDANITVDSNGYGLACGGVSASLRDLARFADVMLNEGMTNVWHFPDGDIEETSASGCSFFTLRKSQVSNFGHGLSSRPICPFDRR